MGTHPIFESDFDCLTDFDMRSIVLLFIIINICTGFDRKELKRKKRNSCTESRISKCSKCENLDSSSSAFLKTFCDRKIMQICCSKSIHRIQPDLSQSIKPKNQNYDSSIKKFVLIIIIILLFLFPFLFYLCCKKYIKHTKPANIR